MFHTYEQRPYPPRSHQQVVNGYLTLRTHGGKNHVEFALRCPLHRQYPYRRQHHHGAPIAQEYASRRR